MGFRCPSPFLLSHTGGPGLAGPNGTLSNIRRGDDIGQASTATGASWPEWSPGRWMRPLGPSTARTADIPAPGGARCPWHDAFGGGLAGTQPAPVHRQHQLRLAYGDDIDIFGLSLSKGCGRGDVGSDLQLSPAHALSNIPALLECHWPERTGQRLQDRRPCSVPVIPDTGVMHR